MSKNVHFLGDIGWKGKYHESCKPTPNSQIVQGKKEKVCMYIFFRYIQFHTCSWGQREEPFLSNTGIVFSLNLYSLDLPFQLELEEWLSVHVWTWLLWALAARSFVRPHVGSTGRQHESLSEFILHLEWKWVITSTSEKGQTSELLSAPKLFFLVLLHFTGLHQVYFEIFFLMGKLVWCLWSIEIFLLKDRLQSDALPHPLSLMLDPHAC